MGLRRTLSPGPRTQGPGAGRRFGATLEDEHVTEYWSKFSIVVTDSQ